MQLPSWLVFGLAGVVLLLLALLVVTRLRGRPEAARATRDALDTVMAWTPEVTRVLTQHERQAYNTLVTALPDHMVLAQVPLSRFLKVPKRHSYGEWLHRVGHLNADLLVCDKSSQVLSVVEVHSPRDSVRSKQRHERMARVLKAADVRLVVWIENAIPGAEAARSMVLPAGETRVEPVPTPMRTSAASRTLSSIPLPEAAELNPDIRPMNEPTPSTWFDDFDSGPAPLDRGKK